MSRYAGYADSAFGMSGSDMKTVPKVDRNDKGVGLGGIRRAALAIAMKRAKDLRRIKELLVDGDNTGALRLMRDLFGIPQPETSCDEGSDAGCGSPRNV
jgi:hypothetical protein